MAKPRVPATTEQVQHGEVVPSHYKALAVPAKQLVTFMKQNIGTQGLKPFDLDRVKVPAGGGLSWEVPSLKGPQSIGLLEGIVLQFKDVRSYWSEKFGGGNSPPDCASADSLLGVGKPGGSCVACPLSQFGSATDDKGQPGKGQACRQIRMLMFLRQDDLLPILVVLPPTSVKAARQFFLRLVQGGYPYYGVTMQLALERDKNDKGVLYSKATFSFGRKLEPGEIENAAMIREALAELFGQATVVEADVRASE